MAGSVKMRRISVVIPTLFRTSFRAALAVLATNPVLTADGAAALTVAGANLGNKRDLDNKPDLLEVEAALEGLGGGGIDGFEGAGGVRGGVAAGGVEFDGDDSGGGVRGGNVPEGGGGGGGVLNPSLLALVVLTKTSNRASSRQAKAKSLVLIRPL